MIIIKKIVGIGNSRGVILPQEWLAEHERSYGHQILELSLEDRDKTLIITPLYNYGYDSLTWRTDEDPQHGPHQVGSVKANEKDPKWTMLLDKIERSGGSFIEDGWEYWRIVSFADLHDGKLVEVFCGVGRKRVRVGR